mmetsp:Transcript_90610/g.290417  ORF Transcript_90610/g.290417 Transcript_90610/m.290417 type:complete len:415 (-) Transcript_90610:209-1453(-)
MAERAPGWPVEVLEALSVWPLKGRGTVVFDASYFLDNLQALLAEGRGPALLVGGASSLGLPSAIAAAELHRTLGGVKSPKLAELFMRARSHEFDACAIPDGPFTYEMLLEVSDGVASGLIDLTRASLSGPRRCCKIQAGPFGFMHAPRTWAHGAVLQNLEPAGEAELAGCRPGDVVLAANGVATLDAPLPEAAAALQSASQLLLEVVQPILEGPLYLHQASTAVVRELAGRDAEVAALGVIPRLSHLLDERRSLAGAADSEVGLSELRSRPTVFAGDGGSASRLHVDIVPRVQFCHVLHGMKLFAVESDAAAARPIKGRSPEVAFPVDLPLPNEEAEIVSASPPLLRRFEDEWPSWFEAREGGDFLAGPGVSVAACRADDVLCFWGGDRHCGANAMAEGPCIALFHDHEWPGRS